MAASSARENSPKAARSATPSCAFNSRSPARLSNEAPATGVAAAPAMPIHCRTCASANTRSPAITSLGDRRTISPGKSAAGTSPTSNSPVEMSIEASASVSAWPRPALGPSNTAVR